MHLSSHTLFALTIAAGVLSSPAQDIPAQGSSKLGLRKPAIVVKHKSLHLECSNAASVGSIRVMVFPKEKAEGLEHVIQSLDQLVSADEKASAKIASSSQAMVPMNRAERCLAILNYGTEEGDAEYTKLKPASPGTLTYPEEKNAIIKDILTTPPLNITAICSLDAVGGVSYATKSHPPMTKADVIPVKVAQSVLDSFIGKGQAIALHTPVWMLALSCGGSGFFECNNSNPPGLVMPLEPMCVTLTNFLNATATADCWTLIVETCMLSLCAGDFASWNRYKSISSSYRSLFAAACGNENTESEEEGRMKLIVRHAIITSLPDHPTGTCTGKRNDATEIEPRDTSRGKGAPHSLQDDQNAWQILTPTLGKHSRSLAHSPHTTSLLPMSTRPPHLFDSQDLSNPDPFSNTPTPPSNSRERRKIHTLRLLLISDALRSYIRGVPQSLLVKPSSTPLLFSHPIPPVPYTALSPVPQPSVKVHCENASMYEASEHMEGSEVMGREDRSSIVPSSYRSSLASGSATIHYQDPPFHPSPMGSPSVSPTPAPQSLASTTVAPGQPLITDSPMIHATRPPMIDTHRSPAPIPSTVHGPSVSTMAPRTLTTPPGTFNPPPSGPFNPNHPPGAFNPTPPGAFHAPPRAMTAPSPHGAPPYYPFPEPAMPSHVHLGRNTDHVAQNPYGSPSTSTLYSPVTAIPTSPAPPYSSGGGGGGGDGEWWSGKGQAPPYHSNSPSGTPVAKEKQQDIWDFPSGVRPSNTTRPSEASYMRLDPDGTEEGRDGGRYMPRKMLLSYHEYRRRLAEEEQRGAGGSGGCPSCCSCCACCSCFCCCGPVLSFTFLILLLAGIAVGLFLVWPRVPTVSFDSAHPLNRPVLTRNNVHGVWNATFTFHSDNYVDWNVHSIDVTALDDATGETVGNGTIEDYTLHRRSSSSDLALTLMMDYTGSSSSDETLRHLTAACPRMNGTSRTSNSTRPIEMNIRYILDLKVGGIANLISPKAQAVSAFTC
ncbi:hypothetical protein BJ684DRAFT_14755 [Piptocephalis cylindrospora]|uniref:Late embryogenesis abundant protein LEA-2 subgroup domain-containing protein n=1 Tax=Piptocephalis cylindrospora TaxID=1907219 RepID=A0A4P9YA77_9FUNG|nr:hypothetical protein BJ684DRAFT_14755 [Piptocephalis cylindrospora]|eukprot:RKP14960.1 hypothetical protein BJ684DRAFT_14755 [Piptocephalis cylindrospora]